MGNKDKTMIDQKKLDKAAKALLNMQGVDHKRPKPPTQKDLQRRFKMSVDRKGKPSIKKLVN